MIVQNPKDELQPARVDYIIGLNVSADAGAISEEERTVAVVTLLEPAYDEIVPWSHMSYFLGYRLCHGPREGPETVTVVPVTSLKAPAAVMPVTTDLGDRLLFMSLDKVRSLTSNC